MHRHSHPRPRHSQPSKPGISRPGISGTRATCTWKWERQGSVGGMRAKDVRTGEGPAFLTVVRAKQLKAKVPSTERKSSRLRTHLHNNESPKKPQARAREAAVRHPSRDPDPGTRSHQHGNQGSELTPGLLTQAHSRLKKQLRLTLSQGSASMPPDCPTPKPRSVAEITHCL